MPTTPPHLDLGEDGKAILDAFGRSDNAWRTVSGIARQTGLDRQHVSRFIRDHQDLFELSPVRPSGIPLYGIRESVRRQR